MRLQILKTCDQSLATVLLKHYVSPNQFVINYGYVVVVVVVRGKDETPGIEDLGSVLRDSSNQTLHLPRISFFSPMITQIQTTRFIFRSVRLA